MQLWLCPLLAFLLGSIPFGLLISKTKGIDVRQHGSGNIGATNVLRVVGKKHGITCLLLDALKGFIPVVIALSLIWIKDKPTSLSFEFLRHLCGNPEATPRPDAQLLHVITGLCAILGHNYSPWVGFKGGKGIATSAGVLLGLFPFFGVCLVMLVWLGLFLTTRYASVASMGAAAALPVITHLGARFHHVNNDPLQPTLWKAGVWNKPLFVFSIVVAVLAIWKHRSNIRRLIQGTENRLERKPKS